MTENENFNFQNSKNENFDSKNWKNDAPVADDKDYEESQELFDSQPYQKPPPFFIGDDDDLEPNSFYCGLPSYQFDSTTELFENKFLSPRIFEFKKQIICLKAPMGTGKTTALFTYLNSHINKNPDFRFLIVCPTKSLITSICESYNCSNYSHFNGRITECINLVITPNSLWRCQSVIHKYSVVIFDEVEGSMRSLVSCIMTVDQLRSFSIVINIFYNEMTKNKDKKIILMDALLKDNTIDYFVRDRVVATKECENNYVILDAYPEETEEFKKRKQIRLIPKVNDMIRELLLATRSGHPVIASFSDKDQMEALARLINAPSFDFLARIGIMDADSYGQVKVVTCSTSTSKDAQDERSINSFVSDPDQFLETNRILFHTSVVQSGVSLTLPTEVFVFAKSFLLCDTIVQMLGRARNPIGRVNLNIDRGDSDLRFIKQEEIEDTFLSFIQGKKSIHTEMSFNNIMTSLMGFKRYLCTPLISAMDDPRLAKLFANQVMGQFKMRKEPFDEIVACLKLDAKCWDWETYCKPCTPTGGPLTTKDLNTMAYNNDQYDGRFRKVLNQRGICINRDHVEKCVKNYNLLGVKDFDNFQVDPNILTRGFDFIKQDELELFTVTLGFGSFVLAELVRYSPNALEVRSCSSFHATYLAIFDLIYILSCGTADGYAFEVVRDTPHIFISNSRKLCDKIEISPRSIVSNFWAIAAWYETHKATLYSRGRCLKIGEYVKTFNEKPAKTISVIIDDIVRFLESIGLKFEDHGTRRANKRLQTCSLKTLITESKNKPSSELYHFISGISLDVDGIDHLECQIPKHCWKLDHEKFQRYYDISIRHFVQIISDFNGYSHPKYPTLHLDVAINKQKIDEMIEIGRILQAPVAGYASYPGYWLYPKKKDREEKEKQMSTSVVIACVNVRKKRTFFQDRDLAGYLGAYDADKISRSDAKFLKWSYTGKRTREESQKTDLEQIEILSDEEIWDKVIMMETNKNEFLNSDDDELFSDLASEPRDYNNPKRKKCFE